MKTHNFQVFKENLADKHVDAEWALQELDRLIIEIPSWGFSAAGTRFYTFTQKGDAKDFFERADDCEQVFKHTGAGSQICMHIPWDQCDYKAARSYVENKHMTFGTLNTNMFQDDDFRLGTLANAEQRVRDKTIETLKHCIDVANAVGSKSINVWTIDGSNVPGQNDFRARRKWMLDSLQKSYAHLGDSDICFNIEYKLFEPSSYHNDIADWGTALYYANRLGKQAKVTVDLGHHAFGTNVAQIVSLLIDEGKLGAFHLNDNNCGDDDLIPGTINPFRLFAIENEMVAGICNPMTEGVTRKVLQGIDTSFCIEPRVEAMIISVLNLQTAYVKALLVDRVALEEKQMNNDVLGANRCLMDAFNTDISPLLTEWRARKGIEGDPYLNYKGSKYCQDREKRG
ncbi:MAG: L-rhamnose isomerase [Clostridia bacterium]